MATPEVSKKASYFQRGFGAGLLFMGVVSGGSFLLGRAIQENPNPTQTTPTIEPSKSLPTSIENSKLINETISNWIRIKREYETIMQTRLSLDETRLGSLAADQISEAALKHLIDGANLAKLVLPLEQAVDIQINPQQRALRLIDRNFDLNNSMHIHLSAAIIDLLFQKRSLYDDNPTPSQIDDVLRDIIWLYDKNPPITIDKNSFGFMETKRLQTTSKFFQALDKVGLPFPRRVNYIQYFKDAPGGGWYKGYNTNDPFTIAVTTHSSDTSIIHEGGHFLSDAKYLDPNNERLQEFGQVKFDETVNEILRKYNKTIKDIDTARDIKGKPSLVEEYAVRFEEYFWRGSAFRLDAHLRSFTDPLTYEVRKAEYDFMKRLWGEEFSNEGRVIVKNQEYQIGSIVRINDTDIEKPGYFLREDPFFLRGDILPVVFDGDVVEIIEGPQIVPTGSSFRGGAQDRLFWKVRINGQSHQSYLLSGLMSGEGWMPADGLGVVLKK